MGFEQASQQLWAWGGSGGGAMCQCAQQKQHSQLCWPAACTWAHSKHSLAAPCCTGGGVAPDVSSAVMMWEKRRPRRFCRCVRTSAVTCNVRVFVECACLCAHIYVSLCSPISFGRDHVLSQHARQNASAGSTSPAMQCNTLPFCAPKAFSSEPLKPLKPSPACPSLHASLASCPSRSPLPPHPRPLVRHTPRW